MQGSACDVHLHWCEARCGRMQAGKPGLRSSITGGFEAIDSCEGYKALTMNLWPDDDNEDPSDWIDFATVVSGPIRWMVRRVREQQKRKMT